MITYSFDTSIWYLYGIILVILKTEKKVKERLRLFFVHWLHYSLGWNIGKEHGRLCPLPPGRSSFFVGSGQAAVGTQPKKKQFQREGRNWNASVENK